MRTIHEVIASVCRMTSEFHQRGDVSILHLAEISDYRAHQTILSVQVFYQYLQGHPELVG